MKWIIASALLTISAIAIALFTYTQYTQKLILPERFNSNGAIYSNYRYIIKTVDFIFLRRDAEVTTLWIVPRTDPDNYIQVRLVNQDARTLELIFKDWTMVETRPDFVEFVPSGTACPYLAIDININETGSPYTIIHERGTHGDPWQFGATKGVLCLTAPDDSQDLINLFKLN